MLIVRCSVDYAGKLSAHLPEATRLLLLKGDGSVLIHSEAGSYKPLNWMNPPCTVSEPEGGVGQWRVVNRKGDGQLVIEVSEVLQDISYELGEDPGLQKDGVEAHLQQLLADRLDPLGSKWSLVRREFPTAIGPVDLL